jgi:hypothetical protein
LARRGAGCDRGAGGGPAWAPCAACRARRLGLCNKYA